MKFCDRLASEYGVNVNDHECAPIGIRHVFVKPVTSATAGPRPLMQ